MKKRKTRHARQLKPALIAAAIAAVILLLWYILPEELDRTNLVGEAKMVVPQIHAQATDTVGRCTCTFSAQHTRYFSSNLKPNGQRLEFPDNDAHSRAFNTIKSDLVRKTENLELELPTHFKGFFVVGDESSAESRIFRASCSQQGSYRPIEGACYDNSNCQQLCPNLEGVGDLILQIERDCAEFIGRGFVGIIENKLAERGVSLFVQRDLDDVSITGACEFGDDKNE